MTTRIGAVGGAFFMLLACTGITQAQTISYADAMSLLSKDCGADVKKFCKGLNLGNNEIRNCLEGQPVSSECTATLASVTASIERRLAAQASVFKICASNANQHCKGVVGEVHILQCLIKTERIDSAKCTQAITDAGWR